MNSKDGNRILVFIPAFNEAKTIAEIIKKSKKYATGLIVYDVGSTDDASEITKSLGATIIRISEKTLRWSI